MLRTWGTPQATALPFIVGSGKPSIAGVSFSGPKAPSSQRLILNLTRREGFCEVYWFVAVFAVSVLGGVVDV